ncbi:hypothetical protein ACQW02_12705 [Humitalea sp. 24SJ18S-53]|uniref:hypothetical protein n=1 Tax=Humitalea sp. 24SJ18S-53 TaxID=3422307 RepID=UPI003D66E1C7
MRRQTDCGSSSASSTARIKRIGAIVVSVEVAINATGAKLEKVQQSGWRHGIRRFVTPTDSVAAAKSNVTAEMFRAITSTVLFDHTAASSSMNRIDETSYACDSSRTPTASPL